MVSASRKKSCKKRILFPIDWNSDFTSQNEGVVKKIHFHYAEMLLSSTGMSKKTRKRWPPMVGETLL